LPKPRGQEDYCEITGGTRDWVNVVELGRDAWIKTAEEMKKAKPEVGGVTLPNMIGQ